MKDDDFWGKVKIADRTACWLWQGKQDKDGYGKLWYSPLKRFDKAHRVMYVLSGMGTWDDISTKVVRHSCNNPPCCNPAHLRLGTVQDNSDDKVKLRRHTFGQQIQTVVLTEEKVLAMRHAVRSGECINAVSERYGISLSAGHSAITGKTWKHVPDAVK